MDGSRADASRGFTRRAFLTTAAVGGATLATGGLRPLGAALNGGSHHGEDPQRINELSKVNQYHVKMLAYFVDKLRNTEDGDVEHEGLAERGKDVDVREVGLRPRRPPAPGTRPSRVV